MRSDEIRFLDSEDRDASAFDPIVEMLKRSAKKILDEDTAFLDGRSNGPKPSDFGEFEEIPEDCICVEGVAVGVRSISGDE